MNKYVDINQYVIILISIYCYFSAYIISKGKYYKFLPWPIGVEIENNKILRKFHMRHLLFDGTLLLLFFFGLVYFEQNIPSWWTIISVILAIALVIDLIIIIRGNKILKQ